MFVDGSGSSTGSGYQIANSVRFRSSASAYLSRTPGVSGNRKTWTWSGWCKRGALGSIQELFVCAPAASATDTTYLQISFNATDNLQVIGAVTAWRTTSAVYRDPSAWYHVVVAVDTANATTSLRVRVWVNGSEVTSFSASTDPALNADLGVNQTIQHCIAARMQQAPNYYFDGYMAEVNFIDGQALDASYFGQTDATTGAWVPKAYTGTYGTNGFYLKFNDGSNLTNLCLDRSGNGNNWTATNVSLTAGATYDWMVDTPTNNYCRFSPIDKAASSFHDWSSSVITSSAASAATLTRGTFGVSSGKWYWEGTVSNATTDFYHGVQTGNASLTAQSASSFHVNHAGQCYVDGSLVTTFTGSAAQGNVIGIALDLDGGTISWYKNNSLWGSRSIGANTWFPVTGNFSTSSSQVINFGAQPFTYTPPTGFKALCTANLPAPTILNPKKHFDVALHAGNGGASQSVTGIAFQPDFAWVKCRNVVDSNQLVDSVRGVNKNLVSDSTAAEGTASTVTAFNSNGITLDLNLNVNTRTYVDWLWKANGTAVTNNVGSITSQVSANQAAGFSVVTYTGNGVNAASIGHGLGVAPKMIIARARNIAANWRVYHSGMTSASYYMVLNGNTAQGLDTTAWSGNAPTSNVFYVGTAGEINGSGQPCVAYCFAEVPGFSKIGSYTGNGSADGTFVYCGFRPRFLLVKRSDSGPANWRIQDTARDTYNQTKTSLYPNLSNVEQAADTINFDFTANGFKARSTDFENNASGGTYVYIAFAESPFKYSTAR